MRGLNTRGPTPNHANGELHEWSWGGETGYFKDSGVGLSRRSWLLLSWFPVKKRKRWSEWRDWVKIHWLSSVSKRDRSSMSQLSLSVVWRAEFRWIRETYRCLRWTWLRFYWRRLERVELRGVIWKSVVSTQIILLLRTSHNKKESNVNKIIIVAFVIGIVLVHAGCQRGINVYERCLTVRGTRCADSLISEPIIWYTYFQRHLFYDIFV